MSTTRKHDEIIVSHLIRQMRLCGHRDIAEISSERYGGYRQCSLIPWNPKDLPAIISDKKSCSDVAATDLPFLYQLGGRPWPTQLIYGRKLTPFSHAAYLVEKSNKVTHLRCCYKCAQKQFDEHGYSWWLLNHNLPGVISCQDHLVALSHLPWEQATEDWGLLPHNIDHQNQDRNDDERALAFSRLICDFQVSQMRYCPFIAATTALESVRRGEGCTGDDLIGIFMERYSRKFPRNVHARIGRNESTPPDVQVQRLIRDGVLVSPLATALIVATVFPDISSFRRDYLHLRKDSIILPTGEALPGKRLDRALNWYPQFALRAIFH